MIEVSTCLLYSNINVNYIWQVYPNSTESKLNFLFCFWNLLLLFSLYHLMTLKSSWFLKLETVSLNSPSSIFVFLFLYFTLQYSPIPFYSPSWILIHHLSLSLLHGLHCHWLSKPNYFLLELLKSLPIISLSTFFTIFNFTFHTF